MAQVLKFIEKNPDARLEWLEANIGIEIGLSPRKIKEYLRQFEVAGRIVRTEKGFKLLT